MKRVRRTNNQIFLDKLKELSKESSSGAVSNRSLSAELSGWPPERYTTVKEQLVKDKLIKLRKGHGGGVSLIGTSSQPLSVFIAYSHADRAIKDELLKHLEPLRAMGLIDDWHDQELTGGEEWDDSISRHLTASEIILPLVSSDFISSPSCERELERALELYKEKKARVVPIILRNCLWKHTSLKDFQALLNGQPVTVWEHQDDALTKIGEEIMKVAQELRKRR